MAKSPELTLNPPERSFYRPHDHSTGYTGLLANPITGELKRPVHRVKQEFREECDINNIIKQYKLTGQIQHINAQAKNGSYEDLPDPIDYQESLNAVAQASSSFATLPSHVRERFSNNPGAFLSFMNDPKNRDEMVKLGLAKKLPTPPSEPTPPPPVKPETPPENK
ncbi:MAG: internal scaffolding protein [Microviridae sp.]|nr:MAG: internal scaffolding protein [Microviridae sp.]